MDLDLTIENKKLINSYIPVFVQSNLKSYGRDGLPTYIDQLKYNEFIENPEEPFRTAKVISFDIIHNECREQPITEI